MILDGDLWIGTSGGLSRLHDGAFSNYTVKQGLSDNVVTTIAQDQASRRRCGWAPTGAASTACARHEPNFDSGISPGTQGCRAPSTAFSKTASGRLWLSSKTGIFRVSLAQLDPPAAERGLR